MSQIPTPAQVVDQLKAAAEREQERERVKTVRKRRRLQSGGLSRNLDPATAAQLAKLAHPDVTQRR